jgi:hypothetical protein
LLSFGIESTLLALQFRRKRRTRAGWLLNETGKVMTAIQNRNELQHEVTMAMARTTKIDLPPGEQVLTLFRPFLEISCDVEPVTEDDPETRR